MTSQNTDWITVLHKDYTTWNWETAYWPVVTLARFLSTTFKGNTHAHVQLCAKLHSLNKVTCQYSQVKFKYNTYITINTNYYSTLLCPVLSAVTSDSRRCSKSGMHTNLWERTPRWTSFFSLVSMETTSWNTKSVQPPVSAVLKSLQLVHRPYLYVCSSSSKLKETWWNNWLHTHG